MSLVIYVARVIVVSAGYAATFPDLPGVSVSRETLPKLLQAGREHLLLALKVEETEHGEWPTPTPFENLPPSGPGEMMLAVDVQVDDTPTRINISMGEHLLKRLDAAAQLENMTRSGFIAAAVGERLRRGAARPSGEDLAQRIYQEVLTVGRRVHETLGPESPANKALTDLDTRAVEGLRRFAESIGSAMQLRPREPEPFTEPANTAVSVGDQLHPNRRDVTPPHQGPINEKSNE